MENNHRSRIFPLNTKFLYCLIMLYLFPLLSYSSEIDDQRSALENRLISKGAKLHFRESGSDLYYLNETLHCRIDYDLYLNGISRVNIYRNEQSTAMANMGKCIPSSICEMIFIQLSDIFPLGKQTNSYLLDTVPSSGSKRETKQFENARVDTIYKNDEKSSNCSMTCITSYSISYYFNLSGKIQSKVITDDELGEWMQKHLFIVSGKSVEVSKETYQKFRVGSIINLRVMSWEKGSYISIERASLIM
jgi:hypothetical protein